MRKRKKKAIVLDVDDCIMDFINMLCFLFNQFHGTVVNSSHFTEYDMTKINFVDSDGNEVDGADLFETFKKYEANGLYALLDPLNHADEALDWISERGYKIILLTARNPEFELQTIASLAKHKIKYDELIFAKGENKAKIIRKLSKTYNIVAFADDKASTVQDVYESTNVNDVYLINQHHNKDYEVDEEVKRINKIFEILEFLKKVD